MPRELATLQRRLLAFVQTLPGAWLDHPWGEVVAKVGAKVFVFGLGSAEETAAHRPPGIAVKLTDSHAAVSKRSFATPTGYGLGKSGWLTLRFDLEESPREAELESWIEESYRLIAPKKLLAQLGEPASHLARANSPRSTRQRAVTRKSEPRSGRRGPRNR